MASPVVVGVSGPAGRRPESARVAAPALVGRDAELDVLAETLASPPAVAVIEGEAGIGKTRLVAELRAREELAKRRWLQGGCRKIREPFPLGPVIEAVRGLDDDELRAVKLSPVVGALRPLLPELARWLPPFPEPLDDRGAERHRIFRALAELVASVDPVVLVLEDLHWADEQTAEFLTYLLGGPPPALSVVLTYRGEETDPGVRAITAKLPVGARRAEVVLDPLDAEQTGTLAASILGTERVSTEFAAHLHARASGVPFAIEELLALLRARGSLARTAGGWARKAIDELDVPTGIRDPVLERVSRLSDAGRRVVEAAAVLQEPAPVSLLLAVSRVAKSRALRGVEEALTSGVLVEHSVAVGFRHVLAAQAMYEATPGARRQDLHGRAATALETLDPVPLGQLAHHLKHAGRVQEWAVAAERAADRAVGLGHDDEAVRLLGDVLRRAPLDTEQRGRIAVKLGRAAHETLQSSQELIDLLSGVSRQDLPRPVRGELAFWLSTAVQDAGGDPALKRRLLLEAVEHLDDRPNLQSWGMVGLGIATHPGVPLAEHRRWLDRVVGILPRIDDPALVVFLLGKVAMSMGSIGDRGWQGLVQCIEDQTADRPRRRSEVDAYQSIAMVACYMGHYPAAERLLARALDGAAACESGALQLVIRSTQALLDCRLGRWDGLVQRVDTLLDELADVPLARVDVDVAAGVLALAHGDLNGARRRLTEVAQQLETIGEFHLLALALGALARLSSASAEPGTLHDTVARLDALLAGLVAKDHWAPVALVLPEATQILIAAESESEAQALVARAAKELVDLDAPLAPAALRSSEGFLAATAGEWAVAAEHFLAAADLYEKLECPYEEAQAREQAGSALFAVGDVRAEPTMRAALATYERLGASWDLARCTKTARDHGVRLPVPHRGGRKGYGDALSPREEQVARLAARGCTNKEIADELFLSQTTVSKHLAGAMRKLGVHTRAAIATRLDEPAPGPG